MNSKSETDNSKIELRSDRVRKVIGEVPTTIVRIGFLINIIVLLALVLAISLIPYPYSGGESILQHVLAF